MKKFRKLIDLDTDTVKKLKHKAVDNSMSLKKFIETELIKISGK